MIPRPPWIIVDHTAQFSSGGVISFGLNVTKASPSSMYWNSGAGYVVCHAACDLPDGRPTVVPNTLRSMSPYRHPHFASAAVSAPPLLYRSPPSLSELYVTPVVARANQ